MNIFYLHNDPSTCAKMHVDKHCVKMILEYAQLLSTAHEIRLLGLSTYPFGGRPLPDTISILISVDLHDLQIIDIFIITIKIEKV